MYYSKNVNVFVKGIKATVEADIVGNTVFEDEHICEIFDIFDIVGLISEAEILEKAKEIIERIFGYYKLDTSKLEYHLY